jgi:hypothetical protein
VRRSFIICTLLVQIVFQIRHYGLMSFKITHGSNSSTMRCEVILSLLTIMLALEAKINYTFIRSRNESRTSKQTLRIKALSVLIKSRDNKATSTTIQCAHITSRVLSLLCNLHIKYLSTSRL